MHHIEEHILELYVLNSASVEERRAGIEQHLAECVGCRQLVEQMRETYRVVEENFRELQARSSDFEDAIAERLRRPVETRPSLAPSVAYRPVTTLQRFQYFVRRHPMMAGGGAFVACAGLALLANVMLKPSVVKDEDPASYRYNEVANSVEILNKKNEILWQILSKDVASAKMNEYQFGTPLTIVDDIDGDGKNEVLTVLWQPQDGLAANHSLLRVYRSDNVLLWKKSFEEPVRYLSRKYLDKWVTNRIVTIPSGASGTKEILACWDNGRSPDVIVRYDHNGNELGEYWHFGNIEGMFPVDLNGDGKNELILTGINDALDSLDGEFPAIALLDPYRIVGNKKSVCSPGFTLPLSDAELYYVQLPVSPLSKVSSNNETVVHFDRHRDGTLAFGVMGPLKFGNPDGAGYEYVFSPDLRVIEVKSTTATDQLYERKAKQGILRGSIDAVYLTALKDGVRYWDGEKWVKEPVRTKHTQMAQK